MHLGADAYVVFGKTAEEDVICALEHLKLTPKWIQHKTEREQYLISDEIVIREYEVIRRNSDFESGRSDKHIFSFHEISLDPLGNRVSICGKDIHLTRGEFQCIKMLLSSPGRTFEYETLYYGAFGEEAPSVYFVSSVRSLIKRIRHKMGPAHSKYIASVHGVGYKVDDLG
jgi:DNA-binding response OmpR family regulator